MRFTRNELLRTRNELFCHVGVPTVDDNFTFFSEQFLQIFFDRRYFLLDLSFLPLQC